MRAILYLKQILLTQPHLKNIISLFVPNVWSWWGLAGRTMLRIWDLAMQVEVLNFLL